MDCPISFGSSTTANAGFNFSATDDIPLKKAVVDVASRTAADSVHRETVRLADYYEYLPLEMHFAGGIVFEDAEEVDALSSFFRVRTPDALRITLEITKNALGGVTDIECSTMEDTAPQLSSNLSAMVGNILYLSPPVGQAQGQMIMRPCRMDSASIVFPLKFRMPPAIEPSIIRWRTLWKLCIR